MVVATTHWSQAELTCLKVDRFAVCVVETVSETFSQMQRTLDRVQRVHVRRRVHVTGDQFKRAICGEETHIAMSCVRLRNVVRVVVP